jgi:serine/threonine protein kinase
VKIFVLPKTGIQQSEKYALEQIERRLPKDWRGFASLEIVEKSRLGRELDLVLLLPDRILIVELKRWTGQIKSENGYWFLKGLGKDTFDRRGPSPIKVNNDKAKLLKTLLERNIAGGHAILVDSRIVLCGNSPSPLLPEEEKPYVLQLATFLELGDNNVYKRLLPLPDEFKSRQRVSVNPLDKVNEFDLLFRRSPHIRAREFSWNNYKVEGTEIFKHPAGLYREYKAINRDDANAHALLRRWDFSLLGTAASTQNDWVNLAHRESRVFSFVKSKTDELDGVLLQPIGTLASDEVTVDYCELFDLPKKQKRLSDFMETYRGKLPIADRISLVKILVSKFAVLHRVGVAHRDIGDHCIWLDRPHSIRLSGFLTAHFPQMGTIGDIKEQVSSISAKLPEDFFIDKFATSFHRDVFLLGVVAHLLIFEKPPLTDNDKLPQWVDVRNDPISGKLDTWFQRTLSWDIADRWENAEQMLDALNDIPLSPEHTVISLSSFDYFQANTRLRDYEELEEPVENGNQEVFKGMREEVVCLIKVWYGMRPDMSKPSLNHSLLRFLEKARAIQFNPSQWLPRVIDVGLFNKGMLFAREWLDFPTLKEWHEIEHSMEERLNLSLDLLNGLERLHSIHLQHGDIHPGNLLVRPAGEGREMPSIVFIDSPDFKDGTEQLVTTRYAPANYDRISIDERDRYAAVLVICEILYATYQQPDRGLFSIPSVYLELEHCLASQPSILTLAPLKSAIETALMPPLLEAKPIVVSLARPLAGVAMGPMLSDNGRYYIEPSQKDGEHDRLHVSGPGLQLRLIVNKETRKAQYMDLEKLTHTNFQRKISKAIPFEGKIVLQTGEGNEAEDLINALYENAQVFQKLTKNSLFEDEVEAAEESDTEARKERTAIDTRAIWRRLIDAEIDALPEIKVVKPPRKHPTRKDVLLVPYECKVTLEYAPDDEVELFLQTDSGEQRRVGLLDHRASNLDELVVIQRGFSSKTPPGTQFTLQSKRERQSYERRHDAIDRILAGRSVIPDLVNCFERTAAPENVLRFPVPSRADFTEYDLYDDSGRKIFSLNDDQKDAFQKLISSGPLCLLQGPPGTGKTLFIGAFLHYLVSQLGVRNVLLVSQSHEATNNALEGTLQLAARTGLSLDVVRVGEDGMLSEAIRHVGVSALQESFRERFRSEFKNRVMALSGRLALNINFVEDYCYLMVHLQPLSDDIDVFESNLQLTTDEGEQAALKQKIAARTNTVMQLASTITEVGEWISIRDVIQRVEQALVEKHNVVNPSAVEKLSQLIRISHEWVDVLRSGSGNFEEFLAKIFHAFLS